MYAKSFFDSKNNKAPTQSPYPFEQHAIINMVTLNIKNVKKFKGNIKKAGEGKLNVLRYLSRIVINTTNE